MVEVDQLSSNAASRRDWRVTRHAPQNDIYSKRMHFLERREECGKGWRGPPVKKRFSRVQSSSRIHAIAPGRWLATRVT